MYNRYDYIPTKHFVIVGDDANNLPYKAVRIYCNTGGTIKVEDTTGVAISYTLTAGQYVPVLCRKVFNTGTSGAYVGLV